MNLAPSKKSQEIFAILGVLSLVYTILTGGWLEWSIVLSIYFVLGVIDTVIIHRYLAHRSFESPRWIINPMILLFTMFSSTSAIIWVAVHRAHHRYSDEAKDPHSPIHVPWLRIIFRMIEERPPKFFITNAPDMIRSRYISFLHKYHWAVSGLYVLLLLAIDPYAITYAYLTPGILLFVAGGLVNTVNHSFGYRSHQTKDKSTNNLFTGYFLWGEGWHNNHHHRASSAKFGRKWWEFDFGWQLIRLISTKAND